MPTSSKVLCAVREMRVGRTEETRLSAVDTAALAVLTVVMVGLAIWVDIG